MDSTHSSRGWCALQDLNVNFMSPKAQGNVSCSMRKSWPVPQEEMHTAISCCCLAISAMPCMRNVSHVCMMARGAHSLWSFCSLQVRHDSLHLSQKMLPCRRSLCGHCPLCWHSQGSERGGHRPSCPATSLPHSCASPWEPSMNVHVHLTSASVKPTAGLHSQEGVGATHVGLILESCGCSRMPHFEPRPCR